VLWYTSSRNGRIGPAVEQKADRCLDLRAGETPVRVGNAMQHGCLHASPDFSYRVRFRAAMTCATAEPIEKNGGCGLDRRVTTFASPYGRNGPPGGLRGLFGRRFLVRQAVAAAASAA
jgi:hypothetical protein